MGYIAKLTKGSRGLDLNSGVYSLGLDFVPPPVNIAPLLASGTAANKQGSTKRGERPIDRSWSFSVKVLGGSEAQCRMAATPLINMLALAGDEDEPLYLEYRGNNDVSVEPIYGQYGTNLRYEIIHAGGTGVWGPYMAAGVREAGVFYTVNLTIKPYALGKRQRLASATGGVLENTYGTADGRSRGLIIPEETVNKITNPTFGHASDWDNDWSADGSLILEQNANPDFLIPGTSYSAKLTSYAANQEFYQSIAAGNTNQHWLSCYARRPDGGVVSSTQVVLYYGSAKTTTFRAVGNGWYRLLVTVSGIAAATNTGVQVQSGHSVYVTGFQFEEAAEVTPLCWGDLPGCSFSGTAYDSTSSRGEARLRVRSDDVLSVSQGTFRVALRMSLSNGRASFYFNELAGMSLSHNVSSQTIFTDFTNSATAAAQLWNANDIIVYHCTYGPSGLALYRNGVSIATNGAYTPADFGTYLYIGTDSSIDFHCMDTFLDFSTFDRQLTAAQVLADYNNISPHISGGDGLGQQLAPVPWIWSKDGDDVVDNCDDSSLDNWIVCGGIPGNADAKTQIITTSASSFNTLGSIYLTKYNMRTFRRPADLLFIDLSGTADANAAGGEFLRTSVSTTEGTIGFSVIDVADGNRNLVGKHLVALCRIKDNSASSVQLALRLTIGDTVHTTPFRTFTTATSYLLYPTAPLTVPSLQGLLISDLIASGAMTLSIRAKRPAGVSTANLDLDYFALFHTPMEATSGGSTDFGMAYEGNRAVGVGTTTEPGAVAVHTGVLSLRGAALELSPNCYNFVMSLMGNATKNPTITLTMTYYIYVTPKWELLN